MIEKAIRDLNLKDHRNKLAGTLSGGNKRKLSVAMALIGNPPIILLDEPFAGVNPGLIERLIDITFELNRTREKTFLLISHDIHDVFDFCDRIAILKNGEIVEICRSADVTKDDVISMIIKGAR